jgi:hypothetical protein
MERSSRVAVLFARTNSIYFSIAGCDVYDKGRDALTFDLAAPVVAHPPCAQWSAWLSHMSKPRQPEKDFGPWAVDVVRQCGGVLEHPAYSRLWKACALPVIGELDQFGGYTLQLNQAAYGHAAPKKTWLYVCGCSAGELAGLRTGGHTKKGNCEDFSHARREGTPRDFAKFLVRIARACRWSADRMAA